MPLRISAIITALVLTFGVARAESFDRSGYKMAIAVEALVTHETSALGLSRRQNLRLFRVYCLSFAATLGGDWISRQHSKRAFDTMVTTLALAADPLMDQTVIAGNFDAELFTARTHRNSAMARSLLAALTEIVPE